MRVAGEGSSQAAGGDEDAERPEETRFEHHTPSPGGSRSLKDPEELIPDPLRRHLPEGSG